MHITLVEAIYDPKIGLQFVEPVQLDKKDACRA